MGSIGNVEGVHLGEDVDAEVTLHQGLPGADANIVGHPTAGQSG